MNNTCDIHLTNQDVMTYLKLSGKIGPVVLEIITNNSVRSYFQRTNQEIPLAEIQKACNEYRIRAGLYEASATDQWLKSFELTADDFEKYIETNLMVKKIREQAASRSKIEAYFEQHRKEFDRFIISHIVVEKEGAASLILSEIRDEGNDFTVMAKKHSVNRKTSPDGGYIGMVRRADLENMCAGFPFEGFADELIGPVKSKKSAQIIKIDRAFIAEELTDTISEEISDRLFRNWRCE